MTITVNSVASERPIRVNQDNLGYALNRILAPNLTVTASQSVASVGSITAGSGYTGIPAVSFTSASGFGATAVAHMKALTATVVTPQASTGSYAPADTITLAGATGTEPVLTVSHTQVVSATVAAGGSGGTAGTQTVTGTTGTGTKFQASVTVSGGGAITAVLSISVAGDYTVNPTLLTAEPVTGASLTGATLNIKVGVLTATVSTPGDLTVLAAAPVAQGSTTGSGTGATFTLTYGVLSVAVTAGGENYLTVPGVVFTGGGGTLAAGTAVLSATNSPIDVRLSFSAALPNTNYSLVASPNQACFVSYGTKSLTGCDVTLTPIVGGSLSSGLMDVVIEYTN